MKQQNKNLDNLKTSAIDLKPGPNKNQNTSQQKFKIDKLKQQKIVIEDQQQITSAQLNISQTDQLTQISFEENSFKTSAEKTIMNQTTGFWKIIIKKLYCPQIWIFLIISIVFVLFWAYYSNQKIVNYQNAKRDQQIQIFKNYLQINQKFKVTVQEKVVFQNGTEQNAVYFVQNMLLNNLSSQKQQVIPTYIWLGSNPIPKKYKDKLNSFKSYKFIRDCDGMFQVMEKTLMKKFQIMQYPVRKADLCKIVYLYLYSGLYSDLDTNIDLQCLTNYLKDKQNHFQATPIGTQDLFLIYFKHSKNKYLFNAMQKWDFYNTQYKKYATAFLAQVKDKEISKSGCVQHFKDRNYKIDQKTKKEKNIKDKSDKTKK